MSTLSATLLLGLASLPAQTSAPAPTEAVQAPTKVVAKKDEIAKLDSAALTKLLARLLTEIEGLIRFQIDPASVEDRLRSRTARYRQVPVGDVPLPEPQGGSLAGDGTSRPSVKPNTVRLFGDTEKADLPKGTVMLVDGMSISDSEVKNLEDFFDGYSSQKVGSAREKAVEALIIVKSIQGQYKDKLTAIEKEMAEIHNSIVKDGGDFAEVAKKRSHGPSSNQGGDLGYFDRDQMVPAFSQAAFALKLGGVSEAFASPFGIHILKVTGRKKGETPSQDQVRASHILLLYDKDSNSLRGLMKKATEGQAKIAVLNDAWRKVLPAAYR